MKTKFTSMKIHFSTLRPESETCAMTKAVPARKPILGTPMRLLWVAVLILPAFVAQATVVLTSLHSFEVFTNGANPTSGLVQGNDGYFYGTTVQGDANGGGSVFKITTNGVLTSLYSFTGGNDGANPFNGLVQGSDGNFYGTTRFGGTNDAGTAFKISASGSLTSLYSFIGGNDDANPSALVQGSDGNFYGTAGVFDPYNGIFGNGLVFKISTNGAFTSLHSFTGTNDGATPRAGLARGSDGSFYGTTEYGGTYGSGRAGYGTVFKIGTNGALTSLYSFTSGSDGANPVAELVQGNDGNFYGTTLGGGTNGAGTLFKINTNGSLASLYSFTGGNDGASPSAALVQGSDDNFYGTTADGGTNGAGTVFKISANGALTTLYSFTGGNDGRGASGLFQGSDGSFYGTTEYGGQGGAGTVFRLSVVRAAPAFQAVTLSNSTLNLTWSTEVTQTYQLQYSSDLSSSNWLNLGSAVSADGASLGATNSITSVPRRFYRLVLVP
jgi:uncharacterized repeat protein (TIGR03803 family)